MINPLKFLMKEVVQYKVQHNEIYLMIIHNENEYDEEIYKQIEELNRLEVYLREKVDFQKEKSINHDLFRIMSYQNKLLRYLCKKKGIRRSLDY
uniref:Uncharacterized protein n=1 Tax=viral metagenome TaxID=1070528 RepID=A0A6C0CSX5_9ZZZZ